ncbi:MAG: hypothetical protein JXB07_20405 [Anaerolineae bacterium]|nr:hypothetical protein [Anaerolineae bacterium]
MLKSIFAIEITKLVKRKLLWVELAILAILMMGIYILLYIVYLGMANLPETSQESMEAMKTFLLWPGALPIVLTLGGNNQTTGLLSVVLIGALVGQEYTWRTLSLWVSHGVARPLVPAVKYIISCLATLLIIVVALLIGGLLTAFMTYQITGELALSQVDALQLVVSVLRTTATLLPYTALALMIGVVTRSTVAAIAGSLIYSMIIESLFTQLAILFGGLPAQIARYLPGMLSQSLLNLNQHIARTPSSTLYDETMDALVSSLLLEPNLAAIIIALYVLILVGIAIWQFRRQDLTA